MRKCLVFLFAAYLFFPLGCSRILHRSELRLLEEPFKKESITFRTDGYYYTQVEMDQENYSVPQDQPGHVFMATGIKTAFFFNDGYVHKSESVLMEDKPSDAASKQRIVDSLLLSFEKNYANQRYQEKRSSKVHLWSWGLYRQKEKSLELQYYSNHFGHYRLVTVKMSVLNDSILLATHKYSPYAGLIPNIVDDSIHEVYKFRKFFPKPDSTNYLRDNIHKFGRGKK